MTYRALLFAPLLLAFGCDGSPPVELADYPAEATAAGCRLTFECCEEGMRSGFADEAACVADRMGTLAGFVAAVQPAIDAGRLRYDADAAGECIDTATCEQVTSGMNDGPCAEFLVPLVPLGGECMTSTECIEGSCISATPGAMGTCEQPPAIGEPCMFVCEDGARCDFADPMMPTCVRLLGDGEACMNDLECESFSCEAGACAPRVVGLCMAP